MPLPKLLLLFGAVAPLLIGCRTYNTVVHNGPGKEIPYSWDYDEPVKPSNMGGPKKVVNLKRVCGKKDWDTFLIYRENLSIWRVAVKCKSKHKK